MPDMRLVRYESEERTKEKQKERGIVRLPLKEFQLFLSFSNVPGFFRDCEGHLMFFLFNHRAASELPKVRGVLQ